MIIRKKKIGEVINFFWAEEEVDCRLSDFIGY